MRLSPVRPRVHWTRIRKWDGALRRSGLQATERVWWRVKPGRRAGSTRCSWWKVSWMRLNAVAPAIAPAVLRPSASPRDLPARVPAKLNWPDRVPSARRVRPACWIVSAPGPVPGRLAGCGIAAFRPDLRGDLNAHGRVRLSRLREHLQTFMQRRLRARG